MHLMGLFALSVIMRDVLSILFIRFLTLTFTVPVEFPEIAAL